MLYIYIYYYSSNSIDWTQKVWSDPQGSPTIKGFLSGGFEMTLCGSIPTICGKAGRSGDLPGRSLEPALPAEHIGGQSDPGNWCCNCAVTHHCSTEANAGISWQRVLDRESKASSCYAPLQQVISHSNIIVVISNLKPCVPTSGKSATMMWCN